MRCVLIAIALLLTIGTAHASNEKALEPYAGKLVISPDDPPRELSELPKFFKTYIAKDNKYEAWKGPPWRFYLVSWAVKRAKEVTIVIVEKGKPKAEPLVSVRHSLLVNGKLIYADVTANASTGFEVGKTYEVKLMLGKKLLATSELRLRE